MIIKIRSMTNDQNKHIHVATRREIERIAELLNKPILHMSKAKIHQMGISSEETYDQYAVLDNSGFFYIHRKQNPEKTKGASE